MVHKKAGAFQPFHISWRMLRCRLQPMATFRAAIHLTNKGWNRKPPGHFFAAIFLAARLNHVARMATTETAWNIVTFMRPSPAAAVANATNTKRPSKSNQAKWNEGQRGQMVLTLQERGEELSYLSYTREEASSMLCCLE